MGTSRRSDPGRLPGVGPIRALHGILTCGSQRLLSVSISTCSLARTVACRASVVSRIMHRKSAPRRLYYLRFQALRIDVNSILRSTVKHADIKHSRESLRHPLSQGATMPAAHMFAMTWFKSNHRSWYFSCYAGILVIASTTV